MEKKNELLNPDTPTVEPSGNMAQPTQPLDINTLNNKKIVIGLAVFIILVLLVLTTIFSIPRKSKVPGETPTDVQAREAADRGNYKQAQALYTKALSQNKKDPFALSGMVNTLSQEGNQTGNESEQLIKSKPYIDQLSKLESKNEESFLSVGYAYETAGDYQKALTYFQQAVKIAPKSAEARFRLGHAEEFLGNRTLASEDYDMAYSLDPNNPQTLMAKANQSFSQGKNQKSYEQFLAAAKNSGENIQTKAEALTGASMARSAQDEFTYIKEATELSKQAVDTDPNFSPALGIYGYNLYLTAPDKNSGIPYVQRAISANPRLSRNYYLLSLIYRANLDYQNSITNMNEAISKISEDNSIFSENDKRATKGSYTYELAKTYDLASLNSANILSLLKTALTLNPTIKTAMREDTVRYNLFQTLENNQEFINLLKT